MGAITGQDKRVAQWLEQIGINSKMARRVIIDIPCDGAVMIYIEQFGDSGMFEIGPPDLGQSITVKLAENNPIITQAIEKWEKPND